MTKENEVTNRPVLVTTQHRGVFFGYEESRDGTSIVLKRAREAPAWATRAFLQSPRPRSTLPFVNGSGGHVSYGVESWEVSGKFLCADCVEMDFERRAEEDE